MTSTFSIGQARTVYFLGPGLSSAALGQTGCARNSSCGSWIPAVPTALSGVVASAACC